MEATPMSKPIKPTVNSAQASSVGSADSALHQSDSKQAAPKWLGKRVGRFRLQSLIGQGAMGRVFRAEDTTLQRRVALKIIALYDRTGQINPHAERFVTEARAAAALEHPHVVQIYEAGESGKVCYIAMELVEGGSLGELVDSSGPMDVQRACQLIAEAGEALAAAHAVGVIHRDVKPANLMLSRHGRCKVTDFGLAAFDDEMSNSAVSDRKVGTALFVAPEVICGTSADERSDLYSLAATLFYLLTGRPPFLAHTRIDAMRAHLEQPVPDINTLRHHLPNGLAQAITKALDKDPGRRFGSMEQFSRLMRVYSIPLSTPAPAAAPLANNISPQLSTPPEPGLSGSGAAISGSFTSSSTLGGFGSIRSFSNDSAHSSGFLPPTPTARNRLAASDHLAALSEAAAKIDHLAALAEAASHSAAFSSAEFDRANDNPSQIPVATIVQDRRRILGLPLATFTGIAAGLLIAAVSITWTLLHTSPPKANIATAAPIPTPPPVEPILAAEREEPSPSPIAAVAPPVKPTAVLPLVLSPQAASAVPPGVLQPTDIDAMRRIADGKDPAHPDEWAVIQGKVLVAGRSGTGKTFHLRFVQPSGTVQFEVICYQSAGMFEQMDAAFGGDAAKTLLDKTIRVSGKLHVYNGTTVQMVLDTPKRVVIVDKP